MNDPIPPSRLSKDAVGYTAEEVADVLERMLGLKMYTPYTVQRLIREKKIGSKRYAGTEKMPRFVRVTADQLFEYLLSLNVSITREIMDEYLASLQPTPPAAEGGA